MELIPESNLLKKPGLQSQEFKSGFKTEELDSMSRKEKNRGGLRTKTIRDKILEMREFKVQKLHRMAAVSPVTVLFLWSQNRGNRGRFSVLDNISLDSKPLTLPGTYHSKHTFSFSRS